MTDQEKFYPESVDLINERQLKIVWNDGVEMTYEMDKLRNSCTCATCRTSKEEGHFIITPAPKDQPLPKKYLFRDIEEVGRYAYLIKWQDGHETGIYTFELLREIGNKS